MSQDGLMLTAASDDHEGVTFGDHVKSRRGCTVARAGGRHGVAAVVMLSRSLGHGCAAIVCGQPLRTGARSCPRAIIAMICHGGAIGPILRTEAATAVARADMASPSAVPAGTITGSIGSNVWAAMVLSL